MNTGKFGLWLALASALVVGVWAASAAGAQRDTVTVHYLADIQQKPTLPYLIANFERVYPDIHIDVTFVQPFDLGPLLNTQLAAGTAPDLFSTNPGSFSLTGVIHLGRQGVLLPLQGRPWEKRVPASMHDVVYIGKKLYGYPLDQQVTALVYNKALMRQMGLKVPTTYPQLLKMCAAARAQGKYLIGTPGIGAVALAGLMDIRIFAEDPNWVKKRKKGQVSFASSPLWRKTLQQVVVDMNAAGCYPPHREAVNQQAAQVEFANGVTPMMALSTGQLPIPQLPPNVELGIAPFPYGTAKQTRMLLYTVNTVSVWAKSPVKDAALKFVDFLARPKQSQLWAKVRGTIAPYDAQKRSFPGFYSSFAPLYKSGKIVDSAHFFFWNPDTYVNAELPGIVGLFSGQKSVDQVLADMDTAWNKGPF